MINKKNLIIVFILLGIITRIIPHPPNFTSLLAIALFSGAYIKNQYMAILIPLLIMFISDLIIGLPISTSVYISFVFITLIGGSLQNNTTGVKIIKSSILASIVFFIITNFTVFITSGMYTKNLLGFVECYIAAIPFFTNTLISTITYSIIMFFSFKLIHRKVLLNI